MAGAKGARRLVGTSALLILCALLAPAAFAQAPSAAEALERAERRLAEAKADRLRALAAAEADAERLRAALAEAERRRDEARARTAALSRVVRETETATGAARERERAAAALRARLEAALEDAATRLFGPAQAKLDAAGDAVVRETGAPLARRLAALFHAADRRRPGAERTTIERVVVAGNAGRLLVVGAVVAYFVPDDGGACRFHPRGAPVPAAYDAAVRQAADVAEKKAPPAVVRLPLEPVR